MEAGAPPPPRFQTIPFGGGGVGWKRQTPDHIYINHTTIAISTANMGSEFWLVIIVVAAVRLISL